MAVLTNAGSRVGGSGRPRLSREGVCPELRDGDRGLSTSNDEFPLTGGGTLGLCTSTMTDRTGQTFGRAVVPDEVIADPVETVRRAVEWLRQ